MKPRDLIVVAAIVLIAGFAAADALRGRASGNESGAPPTTGPETSPTRRPGPRPQPIAPTGWPVGTLEGSVVFTDEGDCRVRVIGLAGGVERPLSRFAGNCDLWAPPRTDRIAYGLGPPSADGFTPFKLADLARPNADLGGYRALFGVVIWSADGQRVAWCGRQRVGFDLEAGGAARRLPECPAAYTPDNRIAYAIGRRLVVDGRTVLRADGGITFVHFGNDGSVAIVQDGNELVRYTPDLRRRAIVPVPEGRTPILSPRNCAAVFRPLQPRAGDIGFVALPCFRGRRPIDLFGRDASWSPDGAWLAIAEPETIAFHPVAASRPVIRWPAAAHRLAWRTR